MRTPAPGDPDLDGIPNALDIDDDGDLALDDLDRSLKATASQPPPGFHIHPVLVLPAEAAVNANAAALSTEQVDRTLSEADGSFLILRGIEPDAELDCGGEIQQPPRARGLSYCSTGGTGRVSNLGPRSSWPRFPDDFDPDMNGLGTPPLSPGPDPGTFVLSHGATTADIATGDLVMQRLASGETPIAPLQYVFATVPALRSYSDTAGNSATLAYPIAPGGPGTSANGLPAGAPAGEDVVLTLTLWRPQREPLANDPCATADPPCEWIDIGGLIYAPIVQYVGTPPSQTPFGGPGCGGDTVGAPPTPGPDQVGNQDFSPDRAADPANTFTIQLNLSACLRSIGAPSWDPGERLGLTLVATPNGNGEAEETIVFTRQ